VLDQTRLPAEASYIRIRDHAHMAQAIRNLSIRGAPAIGAGAAYGIALGAKLIEESDMAAFLERLDGVVKVITATRPTAQNLFRAAARMRRCAEHASSPSLAKKALLDEAKLIHREQYEQDMAISRHGLDIIPTDAVILTHCNTGSLATAGYGTALGVIKLAHRHGRSIRVLAMETRPLLQGARLTALELEQAGIPFELIVDSAAGHCMARGKIDLVITGADRIARNGDTANKIGTYTLAVLAGVHGLPFYIAAPLTTFDPATATGGSIVIEERSPDEITCFNGDASAPPNTPALNPAFDVTPARLITAFITEAGLLRPEELKQAAARSA
ncbi:MAG: S-methyl-5-thioribose-1-phosphate isomerase, partial [Dehalococcoidaceae bacterium]|nr:S-methyl-5-thioribose-1-phosphate isomerase [Dehalococcoidaceae bacterium]